MIVKPVADLYLITYEDGKPYKYTRDANEAIDAIGGGFKVEEFVSLKNHRAAMLQGADGNSPAHSGCCPAQNCISPAQYGNLPVIPECSCHACRPVTFADSRFVVCPDRGNKRCPHANDHRNACTGSNEPGQEGSAYPAAPQQEA